MEKYLYLTLKTLQGCMLKLQVNFLTYEEYKLQKLNTSHTNDASSVENDDNSPEKE